MDTCSHIALWSGPRNISTALMYAFAQRSATTVYDEPLYGHFLAYTGVQRPDRTATMAALNCNGNQVLADLYVRPPEAGERFTKNIANHLVGLDWAFLANLKNIILIREPDRVIQSYTRQIEAPTELDLAYAVQRELFDYLKANACSVVVIDAKAVLQDPKRQLKALCQALGIAFDAAMLSWPAGARPEDGPWAKYWYAAVHKSTGFAPYNPRRADLPDRFAPLAEACKTHYDYLVAHALK